MQPQCSSDRNRQTETGTDGRTFRNVKVMRQSFTAMVISIILTDTAPTVGILRIPSQ